MTVDVNCAGGIEEDNKLTMLIQRDIRSRMTQEMSRKSGPERVEVWQFDLQLSLQVCTPSVEKVHEQYNLVLEPSAMPILREAQGRRITRLRYLEEPDDYDLGWKWTQEIWKKWQDDWRVGKEEVDGEVVKNARSAFQSYIYKQIKGRRTQADGGAKHLVFVVFRTG